MVEVICQCGARFAAPEKLAGKRVKCRSCGGPIPVPMPVRDPSDADQVFNVEDLEDDPGPPREQVISGPTAISPSFHATAGGSIPVGGVSLGLATSPTAGRLGDYLKDCATSLMFFAETDNLPRFLVVAAIDAFSVLLLYAPCIGGVGLLIINGWIFSFLFNVLLNAADGERDLPELTLLEGLVETVVVPSFQFLATVAIAFSPVLAYAIYTGYSRGQFQDNAVFLLLAGVGVFLWPIVVLIVGLGGASSFARPDLIMVTLFRTIVPYLLTCMLAAGAFVGTWLIGEATYTNRAGGGHPIALLAGLQVLELYTWVLVMRFIGLYYHHFKGRFAWSWG